MLRFLVLRSVTVKMINFRVSQVELASQKSIELVAKIGWHCSANDL